MAVALLVFEAVQVVASVADVVLDVAVLADFHARAQWVPFAASLAVFALAQLAYAFLFVATFGRELASARAKLLAFATALPLAQLVPVFHWLESFHLPRVRRALLWLGLAPSEPASWSMVEGGAGEEKRKLPDDALWAFAHRKFQSNVGFLVEAIVEAVPQAMIQCCAAVVYGETDMLIVASILMSVFVVASKGYMLSYSIDASTFVFNALCVAADICGLFATIVWVFGPCSADSVLSPAPLALYAWWYTCARVAVGLTGCWGLFLCMFANADDHIKLLLGRRGRWSRVLALPTQNVWFDIWIVRSFTWLLCLIPASVLLLSFKATFLPLCAFKTFHPEHFNFPNEFRRLFAFFQAGGERNIPGRLHQFNYLCKACMKSKPWYGRMFVLALDHPADSFQGKSLREFIRGVGEAGMMFRNSNALAPSSASGMAPTNNNDNDSGAHADALSSAPQGEEETPKQMRLRIRRENRDAKLQRDLNEFEQRSILVQFARGIPGYIRKGRSLVPVRDTGTDDDDDDDNNNSDVPLLKHNSPRMREWLRDTLAERILRVLGLVSLALTAITSVLLAPVLGVLMIMGVLIPFVGPVRWFWMTFSPATFQVGSSISYDAVLGLVLSFAYALCMVVLVYVAPRMSTFQLLAKDVVDVSGYEDVLGGGAFFRVGMDAIADEALVLHHKTLGRERLVEFLERSTNPDATSLICKFLRQGGGLPFESLPVTDRSERVYSLKTNRKLREKTE